MDGPASGAPSFCPDCGTDLDHHANYCPGCGNAVRDSPTAAYCRTCGTEFGDDDEFCSNCGTARDPADWETTAEAASEGTGGEDSTDDADPQKRFERQVRSYLANGWEVERDYGDGVVLVDRGFGNPAAHVLLLFFTGGIGNVAYGWYSYETSADRLHLTVDDPSPAAPPEASTGGDVDLAEWAGGVLLALIGFAISAGSLAQPVGLAVGLAFLLGGLLVFPPTSDRIERRKPVTTFGRVQSTEESVVEDPGKPCVVCGKPIDRGIERSYREEAVVAGLPLFTTESGENHYCETCATDPVADAGTRGTGTDRETEVGDRDLEFERN